MVQQPEQRSELADHDQWRGKSELESPAGGAGQKDGDGNGLRQYYDPVPQEMPVPQVMLVPDARGMDEPRELP